MNKLLYDFLYNDISPNTKEDYEIINHLMSKIETLEQLIRLKEEYLKYLN